MFRFKYKSIAREIQGAWDPQTTGFFNIENWAAAYWPMFTPKIIVNYYADERAAAGTIGIWLAATADAVLRKLLYWDDSGFGYSAVVDGGGDGVIVPPQPGSDLSMNLFVGVSDPLPQSSAVLLEWWLEPNWGHKDLMGEICGVPENVRRMVEAEADRRGR